MPKRKITVHSHKHSFTPYPSLKPYGQTEWRRPNTLTTRGLEEPFFQLCCCVSFLVVAEIVLVDTYLSNQLCRYVFCLLQQEIVFGCTGRFFWLWHCWLVVALLSVVRFCHHMPSCDHWRSCCRPLLPPIVVHRHDHLHCRCRWATTASGWTRTEARGAQGVVGDILE